MSGMDEDAGLAPSDEALTQGATGAAPYYDPSYGTLRGLGHARPAPSFGAPTLVWHLALWPRKEHDAQHVTMRDVYKSLDAATLKRLEEDPEALAPWLEKRLDALDPARKEGEAEDYPAGLFHERAVEQFYHHSDTLDTRLNELLERLQRRGRVSGEISSFERVDPFTDEPRDPATGKNTKGGERFLALKRESLGFTLWWRDDMSETGAPGDDAVRVRVQAASHADFVTLTFHLDLGALWRGGPNPEETASWSAEDWLAEARREASAVAGGSRRARLLDALDAVKGCCEPRVNASALRRSLRPEDLGPGAEATAQRLLDAADLLYDRIWREFRNDFGLDETKLDLTAREAEGDLIPVVGEEAQIFADVRGLVLATEGDADNKPKVDAGGHPGLEPYDRFRSTSANKPEEPNEANAVVKAYWPFIRRAMAKADHREVVACGVMDWRAVYVTPLGSPAEFKLEDELADRRLEAPAGALPEDDGARASGAQPIRYLILSKGAPHRRQIGRVTDRIHTLSTLRLYALKDWATLVNASLHVRMRGQELDHLIRDWTSGRAYIESKWRQSVAKAKAKALPEDELATALREANDARDEWIGRYTGDIETRLLKIGAALDFVGVNALGGLHYRVNKSRYFAQQFKVLRPTLQVGNIEGWISYDQFVSRGLEPAYDFIDELGHRLNRLRERLQNVTEGIQTSALVAQSSATRENTRELRKIGEATDKFQSAATRVTIAIGLLGTAFGGVEAYQAYMDAAESPDMKVAAYIFGGLAAASVLLLAWTAVSLARRGKSDVS